MNNDNWAAESRLATVGIQVGAVSCFVLLYCVVLWEEWGVWFDSCCRIICHDSLYLLGEQIIPFTENPLSVFCCYPGSFVFPMWKTKEKGKKEKWRPTKGYMYGWMIVSTFFFFVLPFSAFLTQTFHTRKKKCDLTLDWCPSQLGFYLVAKVEWKKFHIERRW